MIFIFKDNIDAVSKEIVKVDLPNGYCLFKLGKLLNDKNISINQFMRDTDTDFKTIKKHANGLAQQIDTLLIDKWCKYLDVDDNEIYEYIRNKVDN